MLNGKGNENGIKINRKKTQQTARAEDFFF